MKDYKARSPQSPGQLEAHACVCVCACVHVINEKGCRHNYVFHVSKTSELSEEVSNVRAGADSLTCTLREGTGLNADADVVLF